MKKLDLKKELKHLYHPSTTELSMVQMSSMNFLMVDGNGDPTTASEFAEAITTLFAVAYTIKFMVKKGDRALDDGKPSSGNRCFSTTMNPDQRPMISIPFALMTTSIKPRDNHA